MRIDGMLNFLTPLPCPVCGCVMCVMHVSTNEAVSRLYLLNYVINEHLGAGNTYYDDSGPHAPHHPHSRTCHPGQSRPAGVYYIAILNISVCRTPGP